MAMLNAVPFLSTFVDVLFVHKREDVLPNVRPAIVQGDGAALLLSASIVPKPHLDFLNVCQQCSNQPAMHTYCSHQLGEIHVALALAGDDFLY